MLRNFLARALAYFSKAHASEEHSSFRRYEITIIRFTPAPMPVTKTFSTGSAAAAWLGAPLDSDCFIEASVHQDKCNLGDFCLWLSGEYAVARIGEHRDHNASNPDSTFAIGKTITFRDDDGSLYTPSSELVLARELGINAFRSWLMDLQHPSFLRWT